MDDIFHANFPWKREEGEEERKKNKEMKNGIWTITKPWKENWIFNYVTLKLWCFPKCPEILINSNKLLKLWKNHRKTKTFFFFLKCGQQRTYVHIKPIQHPINHLKNKKKTFPIIKSCWFLKTFHKICSLINQRVTSSDFHCCVWVFSSTFLQGLKLNT